MNPAITMAISEVELSWAQKIISLSNSGFIYLIPAGADDLASQEIATSKKLDNSIRSFERSAEAVSGGIAPKSPHKNS